MITVTQEDDNSLTISWDENDPRESILNTWTEQNFIDAIFSQLNVKEEETKDS